MNAWVRFRRSLDRLTLYVPLIIMATLALVSWWLVRSLPELLPTDLDRPVRTEPDYQLQNFTVKNFDATGQLTRQISGEAATHLPQPNELHIQRIRIFAQNELGSQLTAEADQGISSDNDNHFTLIGNVRAVRQADARTPLTRLQGERLTAILNEDRLVSSLPVQITRNRDVFTSQTLDFNTRSGQYLMEGQVRATLLPAAAKPTSPP
jgi:lipopolysaccharide export system protein LptC